ncbi:unnamed protein product [Blumeria hordei]|uniref:Uncharacterized protein n=1 Tax=Blumeria hordei TaxID=2867405 RepID=A0A383USU1_BLUHO|nr:unnamed protein product [Blumeria hordei]
MGQLAQQAPAFLGLRQQAPHNPSAHVQRNTSLQLRRSSVIVSEFYQKPSSNQSLALVVQLK